MSVKYGNIEVVHLNNEWFKIFISPEKEKSSTTIQLILLLLCSLFLITPIILLVLLFEYFGITIGFIISTALCWACAVYFGRRYLWERLGCERFVICNKKIEHIIDYGLFEDKLNTHNFDLIELGYSFTGDEEEFFFFDSEMKNETSCFICFISETDVVISQVETSYKCALALYDYYTVTTNN